MTAQTLSNLAAYSAQVLCVAALGALLAAIVRIDRPAFRYLYWRLLLGVCLALPFLQEWQVVSHAVSIPASAKATALTAVAGRTITQLVVAGSDGAALSLPDWPRIVWSILIGGMALRLAWLLTGLRRLRHLRRAGRPAQLADDDEALRAALAPRACIRDVDGLSQPVTFGVRRPIVLLPLRLREHDPAIRRAVLCHELLHARRRDWLWVLLEEVVRGALWFHPATWWLIARVQLAREEVVDESVVILTGARRTYVEALLLFADDVPLVPAAAFARRRHLFRRIQLIAQERAMSIRRLVLSGCVMAAAMALATWSVSQAFPLAAAGVAQQVLDDPGPLERSARTIAPENPIPRRTVFGRPRYPADVTTGAPAAVVNVLLTIDASGHVAELRAVGLSLSSATPGLSFAITRQPLQPALAQLPEIVPNAHAALLPTSHAFIREATEAVSQWVYDPPASGPLSFFAQLLFVPGALTAAAQSSANPGLPRPAASSTGFWAADPPVFLPPPPPPPPPAPGPGSGRGRVDAEALSTPVAIGPRGGAPGPGAAAIATGTPTPTAPTAVAPPPPPPPLPPPPPSPAPVRVGGTIRPPVKIKDVKPVYPAIALSARVQGIIILEVTIDPQGRVVDARVLRSIGLLDQAAIDAARQWEFTPTLLNGQPTSIIMSVTVNFVLPPLPEPAPEPPAR